MTEPKQSLAERVRALAKFLRHDAGDGNICTDECPRCAAITIAEHLRREGDRAWEAHCDLAALVADPKKPDWMPALGNSNRADADCLDSAYRATRDLAAALADRKEGE